MSAGCDEPNGHHIHPRRALVDARGIFVAYVCDACEAEVRAGYREDIFTDAAYWADEPIEEDD
jgi:hypothetical protein